VRTGVAEGDVTRRHRVSDLVDLVTGALYRLLFDWSKGEAGIAERGARMAQLLGDALAPRADETPRPRAGTKRGARAKGTARVKRSPAPRRGA